MKKINVNAEACIGCGACVAIDSEHFAFNDEGLSHPISNENLESNELKNAIDSCPTSAITMIEGCNCEEECNCTPEDNCGCIDEETHECTGHCEHCQTEEEN